VHIGVRGQRGEFEEGGVRARGRGEKRQWMCFDGRLLCVTCDEIVYFGW